MCISLSDSFGFTPKRMHELRAYDTWKLENFIDFGFNMFTCRHWIKLLQVSSAFVQIGFSEDVENCSKDIPYVIH